MLYQVMNVIMVNKEERNKWFNSLPRYDDEWYSEVQCKVCGSSIGWECIDEKLEVWIDKHYECKNRAIK